VTPLSSVQDLTLQQGGRRLIDSLALKIRPGECWAVLGPNGSGKTTLLKALAGLLPAQNGCIELQGRPLAAMQIRHRARHVGLVFQQGHTGLHNTTLELVMSGHHPHRKHWWDTREEGRSAMLALAEVGLEEQANQDTQTLSGGELRRAEIARLLVQSPALALLDEPFNHLDIGQQVAMIRLLKQHFVQPGKALLLVTHDINLATQVSSHCLILHGDGRWTSGPVDTMASQAVLGELFDYPLVEYRSPNGSFWGIDWGH